MLPVTGTRRVINEQRYNSFSSDSIRICNPFEKVDTSASPSNRISWLGERFFRNESLSPSKKGRGDCSDTSKWNGRLTLRDLKKLLGKSTSTIQAILPAKLQIRFLQQIQIQTLRKNMTSESVITLDQQAKEELPWWVTNMKIYNGKSLLIVLPDLTIFSDASKKSWDASSQGITTWSRWSSVAKA